MQNVFPMYFRKFPLTDRFRKASILAQTTLHAAHLPATATAAHNESPDDTPLITMAAIELCERNALYGKAPLIPFALGAGLGATLYKLHKHVVLTHQFLQNCAKESKPPAKPVVCTVPSRH